jgi:type VI secretion system secreted protein Hcp
MKTRKSVMVFGILGGLIFLVMRVTGGDLNPPGVPSPTMKTLDQVFSAAASQDPPVGAADARWVVAMHIAEYPGSWDYEGYHDHSKVVDLEYSFSVPYDPQTGQATGARQMDAVCVTKNIDKATPGLGHALDTGQHLQEVVLKFLRPTPEGGMEEYFRITLRNARVVGFAQRVVHRGGDEYAHLDVINFVWEDMEWNWLPDSVVEMIQWRSLPL